MKKYSEVLQKSPLFDGIKSTDLQNMLTCLGAQSRTFGKKEKVLREGDAADWICMVLDGKVQIEQTDYFGDRRIMGQTLPGELFAESFACAGVENMPVDAVAAENCQVLFIDRRRITSPCAQACSFHQQVIYNLMKIVAEKNLLFHQKLQITSKRTTREKLMAFLLLQAKSAGNPAFTIPFDRQALADYLGVDRSGLSAEISKLRREGVLRSMRDRFELLKTDQNL